MAPVIVASLLCFILPAFVVAGFVFMLSLRNKKAVGIVVGEDVVDGESQQLVAPIVEFMTPDGQKIVFTEKVHSSETILETIAELAAVLLHKKDPNKVMVLYDPKDPRKARVGTFGNLYMLPLVLFAFGLLVMLSTVPAFSELLAKVTSILERLPF